MTSPLSPTTRSTPRREKERAQSDRAALYDVLDASLICHLGVVVDGVPLALPTVFGVDPEGPDEGGTLYFHGSVASRSLVQAPDQEMSVTMTVLDGIVLARSGFNHSMNYRSAVVIGRPRVVVRQESLSRARRDRRPHGARPVDRACAGPSRKELAATTVLALPLHEASVKRRSGDPEDEDFDVEAGGVWAGVVPLRSSLGDVGDRSRTRSTSRARARRGAGQRRCGSDRPAPGGRRRRTRSRPRRSVSCEGKARARILGFRWTGVADCTGLVHEPTDGHGREGQHAWRTASSAATWPLTSAPPTRWSTSAARACCSTSRRSSR